jgi:hypothetical protein
LAALELALKGSAEVTHCYLRLWGERVCLELENLEGEMKLNVWGEHYYSTGVYSTIMAGQCFLPRRLQFKQLPALSNQEKWLAPAGFGAMGSNPTPAGPQTQRS